MRRPSCPRCAATDDLTLVIRGEYGHEIVGQADDGTLLVGDAVDRPWRALRKVECGGCGHRWPMRWLYRLQDEAQP